MAKNLAIRQLLDCPEKEFWQRIFRSEDFNHYLYEGLGFGYELQEWNQETGYRRAKIWPTHQMPTAVARVLGERFSYVEEGTFDAEAYEKAKADAEATEKKLYELFQEYFTAVQNRLTA